VEKASLEKLENMRELSASSQQNFVDGSKEVYLDIQKAFNKVSHRRDQCNRIYYGVVLTRIG